MKWLFSRLIERLPDWRIVHFALIVMPQSWQDQNDGIVDERGYWRRVSE